MTSIVALEGKPLRFRQKSIWKKIYELTDADVLVGTLSFPGVFSDRSIVEHGEGKWMFETKGVFHPVAMVRAADIKKPITTISLKQTRGTFALKLPHYRTLRLTANIWKSEYVLKTSMNAPLCTMKTQQFPKFGCDVLIERNAQYIREYPWLPYLVLYIALLAQRKHS